MESELVPLSEVISHQHPRNI
jgi:hypothetical protein